MSRVFEGHGVVEEYEYYHFKLQKRGDYTILHGHARNHLTEANKPVGVYAQVGPDKFEVVEKIGFFDLRLVKADVNHIVFAYEDDTEVRCLFCKFKPDGTYDPEAMAASKKPYIEECPQELLPQLIKEALDRV